MKKRRHLTTRIMLMICILAAGAILVCWLVNTLFLERYYVRQKENVMVDDFYTMYFASANRMLQSDAFSTTFDNICDKDNMTILVLGNEGRVILTSTTGRGALLDGVEDLMRDVDLAEPVETGYDYQLMSLDDEQLHSEYLVLVGDLAGGETIVMRTAVESIRESAMLSNRLLLIVGLIAIAVSLFVGWLLARRITRPILQLANISKRMVGLDFEAKYVPGAWKKDPSLRLRNPRGQQNAGEEERNVPGNEIDLLGDRMNRLSEALEETISELKSANLSLMKDIEQKTQVDEMRREFISNVSHELKTPLALIQGYAEGLQECIDDDPASREFYCDVIIDEAGKMNRMVQELVELDQMESGEDAVSMERFDITELIKGVANASQILMDNENITLDMSGLESAYVWGDPFEIEEVVTNYLSNAIHHCDGEKRIRIYYTRKGDLLRVSVFNTGTPIPDEDLDQVWDKFFKVDKAHTREYGGSGIGLSIVKAVMDSHGQQCGVENHEDGVEFWFELSTR